MSPLAYEYQGLIAQAWDVLRGDTSKWADRFFFRELIRKFGQPVLDVGCGTGRLLLDYLLQGVESEGMDNSPDMLALCQQKAKTLGVAPVLYEQYMETLSIPRQYRTILIPSSTLQLITAVRTDDGAKFRRVACTRYEPESECEHTEDLYQLIVAEHVVAEEVHRRSPATRSYSQAQARRLFQCIGFNPIVLYQGFTFEPITADDTDDYAEQAAVRRGSTSVPGRTTQLDTLFTVVGQKAGGSLA
jgi:SAM-dependent methyltransferase